eukprot:scaffold58527_cov50-Attheya_sp.AAC.1
MAVDRSKFRTCAQTSFCRRHRGGHSASLYHYRLDPDSVQLLEVPGDVVADAAADAPPDTGVWSSVKKRMLGDNHDQPLLDPYVKGPGPVFQATLLNTNANTNADSSSSSSSERLQLAVHGHADGMARIRITEVYGSAHTPYEKARWTSDELVLNTDELISTNHVEFLSPSAISELLTYLPSINNNMKPNQDASDYIGVQYGADQGDMILLFHIDPFSFTFWRKDDLKSGPIVQFGEEQLMHFEVRRSKEASNSDVLVSEEDDADFIKDGEEEDRHGGKEIVGYWEDGLAIYADGSREEKETEDEEDEKHRKLLEEQAPELDTEGMWEETFSSHEDSKPYGPMSIGMDLTFPNSQHLFGLPEHASSTHLKSTFGQGAHYQEPYRMYNLDVFEYELDETMALYGHIPFLVSHSVTGGTVGAFWFNPTETFVDIQEDASSKHSKTHWMSESGIIDLFLLPGPTAEAMYEQYAHLTGRLALPPMFSLGYHQCRWNYKDERDVYQVHEKFEELDYPYDVLWLDIEHTDGKRYFTWDDNLFPHPAEMQEKLWHDGRRMVTIVDPHIKRDNKYYIHKEATSKGLYVKDNSGKKDFDGWCWPGSSSYVDFTNANARSWWADQFSYKKYQGSTPSLFTWNDMNEPSVFNGPEVSMQKDILNLDGIEHREWHNLYGMLFQRATGEGLVRRNQPDENIRPFVLSRAFFAGSQKYGAIWTGDNEAKWSHLEIAAPMLLSMNVGALSFVGADVGGFFGNPDAELMTRWMQAGSYTPFFRGHAHHDSARREPWMFGDETLVRLRHAAMARYALLPFWYTVFYQAAATGMPIMRTMWMQYPQTESLFSLDDQYLIGSDLLVKPVTGEGVTQTTVSFPSNDLWYNVDTSQVVPATTSTTGQDEAISVTVDSDIDKIPVYQRGGSIIPRKLRLRRSTHLMTKDPYTLYVALDKSQKAVGELYMDDEVSFDHDRRKNLALASFSVDFSSGNIANSVNVGSGWTETVSDLAEGRMVERIIVMGVDKAPKSISTASEQLQFDYSAKSRVLVIRKPNVSSLKNWQINITV